MSMTIPQKKYFVKRIDEIVAQKKMALEKDKIEMPGDNVLFLKGVEDGTLKIRALSDIEKIVIYQVTDSDSIYSSSYMRSVDVRDIYEGYEELEKKTKGEVAENKAKIDKLSQQIDKEATVVKDSAMFGDETQAYTMLEKFVEWQPK